MLKENAVDGLANIKENRNEAVEASVTLVLKFDEQADISRMLVVDVAITGNTNWSHLKVYAKSLKRNIKRDYGAGFPVGANWYHVIKPFYLFIIITGKLIIHCNKNNLFLTVKSRV